MCAVFCSAHCARTHKPEKNPFQSRKAVGSSLHVSCVFWSPEPHTTWSQHRRWLSRDDRGRAVWYVCMLITFKRIGAVGLFNVGRCFLYVPQPQERGREQSPAAALLSQSGVYPCPMPDETRRGTVVVTQRGGAAPPNFCRSDGICPRVGE